MPLGIGIWELLVLLGVLLLVFGPKKLPEMGRSIGRGMREFKNSISTDDDDDVSPELPDETPRSTPKRDTTTT
jgi:sec-independent protein translocase protein TatA